MSAQGNSGKLKKGKVYLVGAGPGKPDLITVRGRRVLREADVIIYDYLVDRRTLESAKEGAELILCDRLNGSGKKRSSLARQESINRLLVKKTRDGKKVVRLKNGDPLVFGRSSGELEALRNDEIEFEIVPGITAASAASSSSGIPLTDKRFASSCVFVTGREGLNKRGSLIDWNSLSKSGTVVFYMAVGNLRERMKRLMKAGRDKNTPAAVIQCASLPSQKILNGTLKDIAFKAHKRKIGPPAIVIVGEVVGLGKKFNGYKRTKRILFTGLARERFFTMDTYVHVPMIQIEPLADYHEFDGFLKEIEDFDWIVFSSRFGVEYFFKRLRAIECDARKLGSIKIAAVGQSTAGHLMKYAISPDLVPLNESAQGLIEVFEKEVLKGKRIFLPRSNISDKGLETSLKKLGANVIASFAYRNVMPEDLPDLDLGGFDEIMFTSPSTVRNFKTRYRKVPRHVKVNCMGEVTSKEAARCGLSGWGNKKEKKALRDQSSQSDYLGLNDSLCVLEKLCRG